MHDFHRRLDQERQRLLGGAARRSAGLGTVRFVVHVAEYPIAKVLARAHEVLLAINDASRNLWPDEAELKRLLPLWFVRRCANKPTAEEAQAELARWRALPWEQKLRHQRECQWNLNAWLHWMKPEERAWLWWGAAINDEHAATVVIEVDEWPFPWGALAWLLRAAGADCVEPESEGSD